MKILVDTNNKRRVRNLAFASLDSVLILILLCVVTYKSINISRIFNTSNLCCVICPSDMLAYSSIKCFSIYTPRFP